ncbi:hypothetical protein AB6A40_000250 [Gnathostoma spinigerum]|uniref:Acid sphingomyelinase-like phosphodiesterase n=1 Tax=Gnathostoma spinigerum TaxID=75299 RepID=A0ABD6E850_9BILA
MFTHGFIFAAFLALVEGKLKILQFTDFHLDVDYSEAKGSRSSKCHASNGTKSDKLGPYGDYICDSPLKLVQSAIDAASQTVPNPEFIFWTGDSIPHISDYDEAYVLNSIKLITDAIKQKYPKNVLPAFGNHDYAPADALPDHECPIYAKVYEMWKDWIGPSAKATFLKGAYYAYKMNANTTVLVLNTNLYYKPNKAIPEFINPDDPADQFAFMENILTTAESDGRTVHVIAHIAPGVFEKTPNFSWMVPRYNQRLINITVKYAKTIGWMIFGHHHSDTFHIIKDPKSALPVQLYLMAPAITPWFSTLPGAGANNPSIRVFEYEPKTNVLLDVKTYYANLDELNQKGSVTGVWKLEYSMAEEYKIAEVNAATMNQVLESIKHDRSLLDKYIEYNSVRWNVTTPYGKFWAAQVCSIEFPDYEGYDKCMKNPPPMPGSSNLLLPSVPAVFIAVLFSVVFALNILIVL